LIFLFINKVKEEGGGITYEREEKSLLALLILYLFIYLRVVVDVVGFSDSGKDLLCWCSYSWALFFLIVGCPCVCVCVV
jgi:hypothetical protein